jgi:hypothetical protein
MSKQTEQLVELPVVLRLTPEVRDALVREANDWGISVEEAAASIIEARLMKSDPVEWFDDALRRSGMTHGQFVEAWRKGQEAMRRDSVPPEGGTEDE